jgi:hypothetical protein
MGLSLAKPRRPPPARSRQPARRQPARPQPKKCQQFECAPKHDVDNEYWYNTMSTLVLRCMDSNATHDPECQAVNKDRRFRKMYRLKTPYTSDKPHLTYIDPKYECRMGDRFTRPGCQALLKTVHPSWRRTRL